MTHTSSAFFASASKAAQAAGQVIKNNYAQQQNIRYKDSLNLVTETDIAAEKIILDIIRTDFPEHAIFSEESGLGAKESDYLWIIDPLDGTTNFIHHLGNFTVSIALQHKQQLILGVIYNPLTDELFAAEQGQGATLNNQPITASVMSDIAKSLVFFARSSSPEAIKRFGQILQGVAPHVRSIRVIGSTALSLCYVAAGRCDALVNNDSNFYDFAAGLIIAQEAGAATCDFKNQPVQKSIQKPSDLLVSAPQLHGDFLKILNPY